MRKQSISLTIKLKVDTETREEAIERLRRELEEIDGDLEIGIVESAGCGDHVDSKYWKLTRKLAEKIEGDRHN